MLILSDKLSVQTEGLFWAYPLNTWYVALSDEISISYKYVLSGIRRNSRQKCMSNKDAEGASAAGMITSQLSSLVHRSVTAAQWKLSFREMEFVRNFPHAG